jgi:hypothetical protein
MSGSVLGISKSRLLKGEINHSPDYYAKRVKDEMLPSPMLRTMLQNDMALFSDFDNKQNDYENISNYREDYNKAENQMQHGARMMELFFEEVKTDDRPMYQRMMKDIDDDAVYYDNEVEKIARALLNGNPKPMYVMLRKIKQENEREGKAYNKTDKAFDTISKKASGTWERIKRADVLYQWKMDNGCDRDYEKEINHHGVVIAFLQAIREKMKGIVLEEIKVIETVAVKHIDRLEYMTDMTTKDVDENWVNRWTMNSIRSMHLYNKTNRMLATQGKLSTDKTTKEASERFEGLLNKNITGGKRDFSDFE